MDHKTVTAARRRLEALREIPELKKLRGKDGKQYSGRYRQIIANTANELRIAREVACNLPPSCNGKMVDTITAARHARRFVKAEARNGRIVKPLPRDSIKLFHCRFQKLEEVAGLHPNSVNLVLTDIPFGKQFLPQLPELAAFAKRVLVNGGLFVTYSGSYFLPQVLEAFGKHLTYRWMATTTWDGDGNVIHPLDLVSQCKPILIYSKGPWKKRDRWGDTFFAATKEKRWHPWQQCLEEVERLVRYFSRPNDWICDPCIGGGTSAVAAHNLGRRFVGCDIERNCVVSSQKRLKLVQAEK